MDLILNPLTGQFVPVNICKRLKATQVVDAAFLATPEITLPRAPCENSEVVSLNGLEIDNTNYTIVNEVLTMVTAQLKIGDIIYINFIG